MRACVCDPLKLAIKEDTRAGTYVAMMRHICHKVGGDTSFFFSWDFPRWSSQLMSACKERNKEDWLMMQLFCEVPINPLKSWTGTASKRDTEFWENFQYPTYLPYSVTLLNWTPVFWVVYMARTCWFKNGHFKDMCCKEIGQQSYSWSKEDETMSLWELT